MLIFIITTSFCLCYLLVRYLIYKEYIEFNLKYDYNEKRRFLVDKMRKTRLHSSSE